jgi:UDP-N-acetylglucosamine 2-epimerase (non-hydrolysing)
VVIGTRPEAIKLKPVATALAERGIEPTLVFTGQHPALEPAEFGLDDFPRVSLRCPGKEDPHVHVRAVTAALLPLLADPPDLLVVQGGTSSALGAALAAFIADTPVAHVEAGLRTHDPMLPWPEEEYRTAIDADADLLFAPTELAAANLRVEQVPGEIHITGNTSIDALLEAESRLPPPQMNESVAPRILVSCHRRESWRDGLRSIAAAIVELAAGGVRADFVLHPNAYVASEMRRLLEDVPGVTLLEPCGHEELLRHMRDATLILSDSGGIQEEAPALGVPLLVLRDKTERPEGIACGTARLVGTDCERIIAEARRILDDPAERACMSRKAFPFGDGHAGPRIAAVIDGWLEERSLTRRLA